MGDVETPLWCRANPYVVSLAAGAVAGTATEILLFPLDCLKTRLQSRNGFYQSGGFRGIYRGVGTAILTAAPSSAIFFSTYEGSKRALAPFNDTNSVVAFAGIGLLSSVMGEMAAGVYRVPMDLVKQRVQAGQGQPISEVVRGVRQTHSSIFFASFLASCLRDISHSSLQFPMYEYFKILLARRLELGQSERLSAWEAATCGSVAGFLSAMCTTPMDVMRTRLNLRENNVQLSKSASAAGLLREEVAAVYQSRGMRGFFAGGLCRSAWMSLGGFIFLGSFELAKANLTAEEDFGVRHARPHAPMEAATATEEAAAPVLQSSKEAAVAAGAKKSAINCAEPSAKDLALPSMPGIMQTADDEELGGRMGSEVEAETEDFAAAASQRGRQLGLEPPVSVLLASGLIAGLAVDIPLHPLDTIKTRMQSPSGFGSAGGLRNLWSGLPAVVLVSVPGSAIFFSFYEMSRQQLERHVPRALQDEKYAIGRDAVAAATADIGACVVRVPCEILKQRMQVGGLSFLQTLQRTGSEGVRGFYAGFGATAMREVPFALIQMPLFEELKHQHPWTEEALLRGEKGDMALLGVIGMQCGGVAGCLAGVATTPLDTAKTHIMLTEVRSLRLSPLGTMHAILVERGIRGLFSGALPRGLHSGIGGALWLGAFEWSKLLLWRPNANA